jgi:hypothetical protein
MIYEWYICSVSEVTNDTSVVFEDLRMIQWYTCSVWWLTNDTSVVSRLAGPALTAVTSGGRTAGIGSVEINVSSIITYEKNILSTESGIDPIL